MPRSDPGATNDVNPRSTSMSDIDHQPLYSTPAQRLQGGTQTTDNPCFQFSVLTCLRGVLATKTIFANGKEIGYDRAKNFYFRYRELEYLEDFAKALEWLSNEPRRFIIRGQLLPELDANLVHYRRILSHRDESA